MSSATWLLSILALGQATAARNSNSKNLHKRAVIATSYTDSKYDTNFGTSGQLTTINPGVLVWLNGGSTHNVFGNLDNSGSLFISQTAFLATTPSAGGQTCDWVGHDTNNGNLVNRQGAVIQLNDIGSASAPTYDWYIYQMTNNGVLQMCGRGDTGGSTYQLYNDIQSVNNGLISFEQAFGKLGASFVWRTATLSTTGGPYLFNNGNFRLINVVFHNVMNIYGSGCWQIGYGGVLYLEDGTGVFQNPTNGPSFPGQSITFSDATAVLHMDTAVYSKNSNFGATVYGFGNGNAIEFYETIASQAYSAATGILTVTMNSRNSVLINLGAGYTPSLFYIARNPQPYNTAGYNAVFYNGPAPLQSIPQVCLISAAPCANLAFVPPSIAPQFTTTITGGTVGYTSTVATTLPNGSPSSIVVVDRPELSRTTITGGTVGYTSTVATTLPNGSPSSIVVVDQPVFSTITITGGSVGYTSTVPTVGANGSPTTVVVVDKPAFSTITITGGSVGYTSTVPTIGPNGSPTTVVVVDKPALSTKTITGGSVGYTSTVPTIGPDGSPSSIVVVDVPAFSTITITGGSVGYTSTVPTIGANGSPTTVVVVDKPALSTTTITGGSVGYTSTVPTVGPDGSPSSIVVVDKPALSTITVTSGSVGFTSTVLTTAANGSPTSVVVIDQPAGPSACAATPSRAQALSPSRQTTLVCGTYGTLSNPQPVNTFRSIATSDRCAQLCATSKLATGGYTCFAFGYNPTTGDCVTYSTAPFFMKFAADSSSPVQLFNINCFGTLAETASIPAGCNNYLYPQLLKPRTPELVCGTKGTLPKPVPQNTFPQVADALTCSQLCAQSKLLVGAFTCFSFSYNPTTSVCQTYYIAPYFMGYVANATSPTSIYNINCFSTK